jgi:hypothetical protein
MSEGKGGKMSSSVGIGRPNLSNLGKVDVSTDGFTVIVDTSIFISSRNPIDDLDFALFVFLVEDDSLDLLLAPNPPPLPAAANHDVEVGY